MCEASWPERVGLRPAKGCRKMGGWRNQQGSCHEGAQVLSGGAGLSAEGSWREGSMGEMERSLSSGQDALAGVWETGPRALRVGAEVATRKEVMVARTEWWP